MLVRLSVKRSKVTWLIHRILGTQTDANRAIATPPEICWLHTFRGFVSIDWGHVNFEEETIPNPSEDILTYLNQVRYAIKR